MTDTQILTIVIAVVFPVMGVIGAITAVIWSNKRIDRLEVTMDARFAQFETRIEQKLDAGFEHMGLLLKLHEAEHHK